MTTKYLEFDSTYRDRSKWPLPGEFEIPISQTGRKDINNALDPVSNAFPVVSWSGSNFNLSTNLSNSVSGIIINSTSSTSVYMISAPSSTLQPISGYYINATITNTSLAIQSTRRITAYTFIGTGVVDKAEITTDLPFPDTFSVGNSVTINDPSDFSDPSNPLIFVPSIGIFKYQGFYLFNETLNEYRIIKNFDKATCISFLNASANPIPITWQTGHNFCIRELIPTYNVLVSTPPILIPPVINSSYMFYITPAENIKKGMFVRFLKTTFGLAVSPDNECLRISDYSITGAVGLIKLSGNFSSVPPVGSKLEILDFSYDNLSPFVYNGSLVSQQECVCYEIKLTNLILPNQLLDNAYGTRIAYYPYVYVELSNTNNASAGNNIIYSNNPNSTKMLFRAAVTDVNQPLNTAFINLDSNTMTNTIKFKPNDSMKFSVKLSDGSVFKTIFSEKYSPSIPNPLIQISACFSIKRLD